MADTKITNQEEFEAWLADRPREWAQVIASRAALRVLPLAGEQFRGEGGIETKLDLTLTVFRANVVSWCAHKYAHHEMRGAAAAASSAAAFAANANAAASAASSAASSSSFASAFSAGDAVAVASSSAFASASSANAMGGAAAAWQALAADTVWLESADGSAAASARALAAKALWLSGAPNWAETAWSDLKALLRNRDSNWDYLCGWYIGRLRGREGGFSVLKDRQEALDIQIATQSDEWWKRGPEAVNRDIAEWVEGARSGEPREPNVSGFIVRLLSSREGPFTIAQLREAFAEAKYDVIDKTMRGQLSRLASEGKIWRVATGVYQSPTVLSAGVAPEVSDKSTGAEPWAEPIVTLDDQPNGFSFREADSQLVIAASGNETDAEAARDPVTCHLHEEAARRASDFAAVGGKLDNQIGWQGMGLAASRLAAILTQGPEATAARIAEAWSDVVELGSFLEQDNAIQSGASTFADALDAEMHRKLESLITIASPYVRRYPTAATLDMEAGAFKTGQDLLPQARMIIEGARQSGLLNKNDAATLAAILDTAERSDVQGGKARTVGVQSSRNIVSTAAKLIVVSYFTLALGVAAANSILIGSGASLLLEGEKAVLEIVKDLPGHVGLAFKSLIDRLKTDPPVPPMPEPPRIETPIRRQNENQVKKRSSKQQG